MSRKASKRVSFSPDVNEKPILYLKQSGDNGTRVGGSRNRVTGIWAFRLLKDTTELPAPIKLLRTLRAKVARAVCIISARKRTSRKVSSSNHLTRSRSVSDPIESHRAEALEDCIEFLNSAASLQRSNSVTSNSC
ncbi:hypothetical protein PRUPE_6G271900 [Prunus persica]|uniref:Josephin-like protein n=1 Tax=Prunus persica TaxID=3760 RepID=M5W7Q1_PRUPE|nr:josephin-like protein [Prunus persica]ONI03649.1 hypothetical protein PRUPE_6G271900 [Prunus persica]